MRDSSAWRRWFAWRPVIVGGEWVWLETIECRRATTFCGSEYQYRAALTAAGVTP